MNGIYLTCCTRHRLCFQVCFYIFSITVLYYNFTNSFLFVIFQDRNSLDKVVYMEVASQIGAADLPNVGTKFATTNDVILEQNSQS